MALPTITGTLHGIQTALHEVYSLLTGGTVVSQVQGTTADGATAPQPVVMGGKDGTGKTLSAPVTTDGLAVQQADASKLKVTEASAADILAALARQDGLKWSTGTLTNDDGTTEQSITLGSGVEQWYLYAVRFDRTAGTAANYRIRFARSTGWTLGDSQEERYDGGSTAVATATQATFVQPIAIETDSSGKVYWESGFDAGADNNARFAFAFRKGSVQA